MLAVGVNDQNELSGGPSHARLDRRAIAFIVRMSDDASAGGRSHLARAVNGPIVDDEDFMPRRDTPQLGHQPTDRWCFIEGGDDDRREAGHRSSEAPTRRSTTPSHVMVRTRSCPTCPSEAASTRSVASRATAAPFA